MMNDPGRVVIVGSGPTGLGAAWRLEELGVDDVVVLDSLDVPGGLSRSFVDQSGFTWDVGGHVQFSHYSYYDRVLDRALGDAWLDHERESWIWIRNRFVPYPLQNNIHRLDPEERDRAMEGLERAASSRPAQPPDNFREWILRTFGEGLAGIFLEPYNSKVWAFPPDMLGTSWMGDRVAVPDVGRIRRNIELGRDDVSWGPNSAFRFPKHGGTGAIWRAVAAMLPAARFRFDSRVAGIDVDARKLSLADGSVMPFDTLVSCMPLDVLCAMTGPLPPEIARAASRLLHSSTHVIGVGVRGEPPDALRRKCWMYFPEPHSPYYRVTVFSNYSPDNVPDPGCWSLMAEVSASSFKVVDETRVVEATLSAMKVDGLLPLDAEIASLFHHFEQHGYPVPFLGRDETLGPIQRHFEAKRIFSRGRFGAWKYEVSNQDHSFMQGVELVDRLLGDGEEPTLNKPDHVNAGAFR